MKFNPTTLDTLALIFVSCITIGLFIAGLFGVLDYFIVKVLLFVGFGVLFILAFGYALKNENKKNRPEDTLPDDSH